MFRISALNYVGVQQLSPNILICQLNHSVFVNALYCSAFRERCPQRRQAGSNRSDYTSAGAAYEHYVTVTLLAPGSHARWVAGQGLCHSPRATQPSLDSWIIDSAKQDGHIQCASLAR